MTDDSDVLLSLYISNSSRNQCTRSEPNSVLSAQESEVRSRRFALMASQSDTVFSTLFTLLVSFAFHCPSLLNIVMSFIGFSTVCPLVYIYVTVLTVD